MTLNLKLTKYQASCVTHAVFTQAGKFVLSGHLDECEREALRIRGLFCRVHRGRPIIRFDFEDTEDN